MEYSKPDPKAKALIKQWNDLKNGRANWLSHWEEIADYVMPDKSDVYMSRSPGEKRRKSNSILFDSVGETSNKLLASALHTMLTNPSIFWFTLGLQSLELERQENVKAWLQEVTRIIHLYLNQSNFQQEVHKLYLDQGGFGTGFMAIEEDEDQVFRFLTRPIYEVVIAENNKYVIDTVFRLFKWTARQIVLEFGEDNVPDAIKKDSADDPYKRHEVLHCVRPRDNGEVGGIKTKKPFASFYIAVDKEFVLGEGGFDEFPFVVPRWKVSSGEIYGRSPSMEALPDIKLVNKIWQVLLKSSQKIIDPPLLVPDDGSSFPINTKPGGISYYRPGGDPITPLQTGGNIPVGLEIIQQKIRSIHAAFYIDQLKLVENDRMTATEVSQRIDESLRMMAPILSRQENEALRPMISRCFNILVRRGLIPEAPEEIAGLDIIPTYTSQVARVQRASEADNILKALAAVSPIIEMKPEVLDLINGDEALRRSFDAFGVDARILATKAEVQEVREGRADQEQAAGLQEQQGLEAENLQKVSSFIQSAQ